jgi:hypothetical protein
VHKSLRGEESTRPQSSAVEESPLPRKHHPGDAPIEPDDLERLEQLRPRVGRERVVAPRPVEPYAQFVTNPFRLNGIGDLGMLTGPRSASHLANSGPACSVE